MLLTASLNAFMRCNATGLKEVKLLNSSPPKKTWLSLQFACNFHALIAQGLSIELIVIAILTLSQSIDEMCRKVRWVHEVCGSYFI
jgi:hypothetical protein